MLRLIRSILVLLSFICFFQELYSQRLSVRGFVEDMLSAERLPGATLSVHSQNQVFVTNGYGYFSFTIRNTEPVDLRISFIGYQTLIINTINLTDTFIVIKLQPISTLMEEVVVQSESINSTISLNSGQVNIPLSQIKSSTALLGEQDLIKSLTFLPGVQFATEGTANISVRGGAPEHNLILIDDVPVYSSNHLFGIVSIYNADALKSATLIKGGYPARYGGRASSVLDLRLKEGNMKQWQGNATAGIISSKILLEGPIVQDKLSVMVSARRTLLDLIAMPLIHFLQDDVERRAYNYSFYDITAKINYLQNAKNRLILSYYGSKDPFRLKVIGDADVNNTGVLAGLKNEYRWKLGYGNNIASLRWNHIFTNGLFANTTLKYSNFNYYNLESFTNYSVVGGEKVTESHQLALFSGLKDWGAKVDFGFSNIPSHYLRFGLDYTAHSYNPGREIFYLNDLYRDLKVDSTQIEESFAGNEFSIYIEDDWNISKHLNVNAGYRYNIFSMYGQQFYQHHEPRVSFKYMASPYVSVNGSYSRMGQNIHLLSNSGISLPTDLWVPSTQTIKPVNSEQFSSGIIFTGKNSHYLFSVEAYHKTLTNVLEYKEGASFFDNASWQT